jgi:hypothetical protein
LSITGQAAGAGVTLTALSSGADEKIVLAPKGAGVLESTGPLRLSGTGSDLFHTPGGVDVPSKINVPVYDPGSFGQIVAMGIGDINANRRVLSLFDGRTAAHQPTLAVFSPDENNLIGFSWDGSNTIGYVKNTTSNVGLQGRIFAGALASAPTDGDIPNSFISWWLNEAGNLLTFRVRYSGGTLKTGTIALT